MVLMEVLITWYLSPSVSLDFDVNINNVTLLVRIKGKNFVQSKS